MKKFLLPVWRKGFWPTAIIATLINANISFGWAGGTLLAGLAGCPLLYLCGYWQGAVDGRNSETPNDEL